MIVDWIYTYNFTGEKEDFYKNATHFLSLMIAPTVSSYSDILMNILESYTLSPLDCVEYSSLHFFFLCKSVVETIFGLTLKNRS